MSLFIYCAVVSLMVPMIMAEGNFECQNNGDCSVGQCCSKIPSIMVMSKRLVGISPYGGEYTSSSCQTYLSQGESCGDVWTDNGDCGCAPGMICKYFRNLDPTITEHPVQKRMMHASSMAYKCAPAP